MLKNFRKLSYDWYIRLVRTKIFIIGCTIVALIAIGLAIVANRRLVVPSPQNLPQQTSPKILQETQQDNRPVSFNSLPSPVIQPVSDTVKEIGENSIIITGVNGDMTLPLDDSVVKVFRRDADLLIPLYLNQLKQGDKVQVNVVKPGELVHLILQ